MNKGHLLFVIIHGISSIGHQKWNVFHLYDQEGVLKLLTWKHFYSLIINKKMSFICIGSIYDGDKLHFPE